MSEYVLLDGSKQDIQLLYVSIHESADGKKSHRKETVIPTEKIFEHLNYPLIVNQMTIRKYFKFIEKYDLFKFHQHLKAYGDVVKEVPQSEGGVGRISLCKRLNIEYTEDMEQTMVKFINSDDKELKLNVFMLSSDHIYDEIMIWKKLADSSDLKSAPDGHYTLGEPINYSVAVCKLKHIVDLPIIFENDMCTIEINNFREIEFVETNGSTITLYNFIWGVIDSLCEMNYDPKERI